MRDVIDRLDHLCEARAPRLGKTEKDVLAEIKRQIAKGISPGNSIARGRGARWEKAYYGLMEKGVIHTSYAGGSSHTVNLGPDPKAGSKSAAPAAPVEPAVDQAAVKRGKEAIENTIKAAEAVEAMENMIADGIGKIMRTLVDASKAINADRKSVDMGEVKKARDRGKDAVNSLESTLQRVSRIGRMF